MCCVIELPNHESSVSIIIFVEANASFMSVAQAFVSILVGVITGSECLCPTLGMFCAQLVFPPPQLYLRILDHLISGVLMAVLFRIVHG